MEQFPTLPYLIPPIVKRRLHIRKIQDLAIFISFNTVHLHIYSLLIFFSVFLPILALFMLRQQKQSKPVLKSSQLEKEYRSIEAFSKPFSKMINLRLLIIDNEDIPNGLSHLSNDLRFLEWFNYGSKCLPSSFRPKELVELTLPFSHIKYLWHGVKVILFFL